MAFSWKLSLPGFLPPVDSQCSRFRTYIEANTTSSAATAQVLSGCVALFVQFHVDLEAMNGTGEDAQSAAFALVAGDLDHSPVSLFIEGVHGRVNRLRSVLWK